MTIHRIFTTVFLLIAVSAFAGAAHATDITLFVGAEMPGSIKTDDVKTALDNGPVYGLRFGNDFVRYLGLEHTFAISPDFMFPGDAIHYTCPSADASGADCRPPTEWAETKGFLYNSNLILNFPDMDQRMVPFLTAGVGLIHQYGDRNLPVGTKFAFNYGGGLKFPNLAGPLGARVDLRGYRAGVLSKSVNMVELSFGLMISLGR
ncbi:MAG: hypothetical protein FWF13_01910 [Acidobacteria bacterium]|nr:hypothetical protein [Acidobacteriota bacterium]